jgi:crossover junction endodeoxyribonuclease RuvC
VIILGIDPGLASTGFGAINCNKPVPSLLKCGFIKTSTGTHVSRRLCQIHSDMVQLLNTVKPDVVAIEDVFSLVKYPKAGILLGSVLGVIYLVVSQNGIRMVEIAPKEVKKSLVGYGSADKKQVREAIRNILHINETSSFHAADALATALVAFYRESPKRF